MEKITSFTINHLKLLPGIYVSRKDQAGDSVITTFDIRMTRPNYEPVMNTAEIHTIEHLAATFLRNHDGIKDRVIYFGPMGCRTGFTCCLQAITSPATLFRSCGKCLPLSVILRERFRAPAQETAATIWT